jgi:Na+-transporting methylmalonyl-CoA/oxaloacetate decarboxylase gamma subunit
MMMVICALMILANLVRLCGDLALRFSVACQVIPKQ